MRALGARTLVFVVVASLTSMSLLAAAQTRRPAASAPAKKAPVKSRPGAAVAGKPAASDVADGGAALAKEERTHGAASRDAGGVGASAEPRASDGGARVLRFGEVEVEGRLKSPQIVYFLRRVRAEFAAGDLGHRSFVRELVDTRSEPGF